MSAQHRLLTFVVAAVLGLSACSQGQDTGDPEAALAAAKQNLDETTGVHIVLSTEKLPAGVSGLLNADGVGTHDPAFKGDIKVATSGITADAAVVAVDGFVYAKLPFTTKFVPIDPADYGAPDPAALMRAEGGLSSLLSEATDVQEGQQVRDGKVVLSSYTASVPGEAVASVIPSASATADFKATFTVNDEDRLSKAVLTGPFYPEGGDVTYTIAFDDYDTSQNITDPR